MARKEGWKEDGAMLGPEAEKEEGETAEEIHGMCYLQNALFLLFLDRGA